MNTLTKSEKFFNTVKLTADDQLFVGVDAHKKSYHVALYLNDAPAIDFVMPAKKEQLGQKLKPAMPALRQIVYETGPTGYGLARHLHNENLPVSVAPTSRIPRVVGSSDKTVMLRCHGHSPENLDAQYTFPNPFAPVSTSSLAPQMHCHSCMSP